MSSRQFWCLLLVVVNLVALIGVFVKSANAGLLDTIATGSWRTFDVTSNYKLDTYGYDVRVYEWQPQDNENVRCVFVAGNKNSTGVACYEVGTEVKRE